MLLICVDALKPTIYCFGDAIAKTPSIDRLAARGVRFDSAYCKQAVCSPSRNSLTTSLRPQPIGIYDLPTHFRKAVPDVVTLGQYFRGAGYHAKAPGKIFHGVHGNIDDTASWDGPHFQAEASSYAHADASTMVAYNGKKRGPATESGDATS